jgi:hypothetical protein
VSGFYSGQRLDNGVSVDKPTGLSKCSHGGILDKTVIVPASGFFNFNMNFEKNMKFFKIFLF